VLEQLNAKVQLVRITNAARLVFAAKECTILIRDDDALGEQRYSIAHECAHIVFRKAVERAVPDPTTCSEVFRWGSSAAHEKLCDAFAEELLMPLDWVLEASERHRESRGLALASRVAEDLGVSTMAALQRLIELGKPYVAVFWNLSDRPGSVPKLRTVWRWKPRGRDLPFIPPFKTIPPKSLIAQSFFDREPRCGWMDMSVIGLGARDRYYSELMWWSNGLLGIIDLERQSEGHRRQSQTDANSSDFDCDFAKALRELGSPRHSSDRFNSFGEALGPTA